PPSPACSTCSPTRPKLFTSTTSTPTTPATKSCPPASPANSQNSGQFQPSNDIRHKPTDSRPWGLAISSDFQIPFEPECSRTPFAEESWNQIRHARVESC